MVTRLRVKLETDLLKDVFVILCRDTSLPVSWLIEQVSKKYAEWHPFPVHEFQLRLEDSVDIVPTISSIASLRLSTHQHVIVEESEQSRRQRELEKKLVEEAKQKREEEARKAEEEKKQLFDQILSAGQCWSLEKNLPEVDVPLEERGLLVRNKGSMDQWVVVKAVRSVLVGQYYFSVKIESCGPSSNSWMLCVGVIPETFNLFGEQKWVGSQKSYSYIAGTGGKCHNTGQSAPYGVKFGHGDVIGVFLDMDKHFIEFFKNDISQGVAFRDVQGPLYPALSMTSQSCSVRLLSVADHPPRMRLLMERYLQWEDERMHRVNVLMSEEFRQQQMALEGESWDPRFSLQRDQSMWYPDSGALLVRTVNQGSREKWRAVRGVRSYSEGVHYFEVRVDVDAKTNNSWKLCIGVVPASFQANAERVWVGSQGSWSYIAGTGGKCFDSGESIPYADKYGEGDRVGVLLDFTSSSIEFFKNGESQGVAFTNLVGPVHPALSIAATGTQVSLLAVSPDQICQYRAQAESKRSLMSRIINDYGNVWNGHPRCSDHMELDETGFVAVNTSNNNSWRTVCSKLAYGGGRRYVEIIIETSAETTNSWRMSVGLIPSTFSFTHDKMWIGAQGSWGYIMGTGGKCNNKGQSDPYGQAYKEGDRIGILMDYEARQIEFFVNGRSQGVAFSNLEGPVYAAASMTGRGSRVRIDGRVEKDPAVISRLFLYQ